MHTKISEPTVINVLNTIGGNAIVFVIKSKNKNENTQCVENMKYEKFVYLKVHYHLSSNDHQQKSKGEDRFKQTYHPLTCKKNAFYITDPSFVCPRMKRKDIIHCHRRTSIGY